jgi:hypothetical protein
MTHRYGQRELGGTSSGWLGVFLDTSGHTEVDWNEVAAIRRAPACLLPTPKCNSSSARRGIRLRHGKDGRPKGDGRYRRGVRSPAWNPLGIG